MTLGQYWIRNRGRVQGPFTEERIQGLLRRGRFSRSFHVSEDKKEWLPASEFPELFAGVSRGGVDVDDESPFQSGGSPFDDDDLAPTKPRNRSGSSPGKQRSRPVPEDDDEDDEDWEDDDGSEDEDWDDDRPGALSDLLDWVEANAKGLVGLLVILLLAAGWFVFGRESFTQDAADLETLIEIKTRINTAHAMGAAPSDWMALSDSTTKELAPMVARLNDQASAMDHIKQELLFAARDDVPKMFKELPKGQKTADQNMTRRFALIEEMIRNEVRQHSGSALTMTPVQQAQSPPAAAAPDPAAPLTQDSAQQPNATTETAPGNPDDAGAAPAKSAPEITPNTSTTPTMPPGNNPASPNSTSPNSTSPATQPPPASSVPGRPKAAQF